MSFISDIGKDLGKAFTDPGALVQDLANAVLPKEVSGLIGGTAAGALDFIAGNPVGAIQHGLDAVKDLPQAAGGLASALENILHGSSFFQPTVPPSLSPPTETPSGDLATLEKMLEKLLQALNGQGSNVTANVGSNPTSADAKTSSSGTSASSGTSDSSRTSDASIATKASDASPTDSSSVSDTSATGNASATKDAAATKTSKAGSSADLKKLLGMSDTDFMNALRTGNIPDSVSEDPKAMIAIQDRMNRITQMNQLITSMMQAMHQMEMAIIQNIRV